MTKPLIVTDPDTGEVTVLNPIIIHPPTSPDIAVPAPDRDPEPKTQEEQAPLPPIPFWSRVKEFMVDGRAILWALCAAPITVAGFMLYFLIRDIITAVNNMIAASTTIGGFLIILCITWFFTRTSTDDALYLKGCPTRSPGVHKVRVCNRRHS